MNTMFIFNENGHQVTLDEKDGIFRICCNSDVYAQFNPQPTRFDGFESACLYLRGIIAKCRQFPKENI